MNFRSRVFLCAEGASRRERIEGELNQTQLDPGAKSVCVTAYLNLRRALHRICNANMSPEAL